MAAIRGRPSQLFELPILLGATAFSGGLAAAIMLGLGVFTLYRTPWPILRNDIATPQVAVLLLVWLDAVALLIAGLLLRNQSQAYADWWCERRASESTDIPSWRGS